MSKKRGLGRGLDALIGAAHFVRGADDQQPAIEHEVRLLPVDLIQRGRYQPRHDFNAEALEELAASIRAHGLMQPIVVRPAGGERFEIIAGERRWRAAQLAGLSEVPVLVRDVPDQAAVAMALIENIQRADLNAIEEAGALQRLQQEFGLTHEQIAAAVSKSRTSVTNSLRLLALPADVRGMLERRELEMGHARALLGLPPEQQVATAREIVARKLSVREAEALVRRMLAPHQGPSGTPPSRSADIRHLERELSETTGAVVSIDHKGSGKGRLVINYSDLDQLEGILGYFRRSSG